MSLLRSDRQVALQEILSAVEASEHYLDDAAEFLESGTTAAALEAISRERRAYVERLGERLRDLGDLPVSTDPDRDSVNDLLRRLRAWMKPGVDARADFLEQLAEEETNLLETLATQRKSGITPGEDPGLDDCLDELANHVEASVEKISGGLAAD